MSMRYTTPPAAGRAAAQLIEGAPVVRVSWRRRAVPWFTRDAITLPEYGQLAVP